MFCGNNHSNVMRQYCSYGMKSRLLQMLTKWIFQWLQENKLEERIKMDERDMLRFVSSKVKNGVTDDSTAPIYLTRFSSSEWGYKLLFFLP